MLGLFGRRAAQTQEDPVLVEIRRLLQIGAQAQERGEAQQALDAYQRGLEMARTHQQRQPEQTFLNSIGAVYVGLRRYEDASEAFETALNLAEELNQSVLVARSLNNIGELHAAQKDWSKAQEFHERALDIARPAGDAPTIILTLENLARDYMEQHNPNYASHLLKEAVALAQLKQDSYLGIGVLGRLGEATIQTGDTVAGRKLLEQAIRLSMNNPAGRPRLVMRWLIRLGELDAENRQYHDALRHFQQAEDVAHRFGVQSTEFFLNIAMSSAECYLNLGNFEAALDQAKRAELHVNKSNDTTRKAKITGYLGLALQGIGKPTEASEKLQEALSHYEKGVLHNRDEYARLLLAMGRSQQQANDIDAALVTYQRVLDMLGEDASPVRRGEAMQLVAAVQTARHEHEEAIRLYQDAERSFRSAGEWHKVARVLVDLGNTRRARGDFKGAQTDFENALTLLTRIEDRITRGLVLSNAAIIYTETGDIDTAQSFYKESIELAQETGDRYAESVRMGNFGWLHLSVGRYDAARENLEKSLEISRELNDPLLLAIQINNLGWVEHLDGKSAEGNRLLEQALTHLQQNPAPLWQGLVKSNLGAVKLSMGATDEADVLLNEALADSQAGYDHQNIIRTQIRLARLQFVLKDFEGLEIRVQEIEAAARKLFFRKGQGDALHLLGDINEAQNQRERAVYFYTEAARAFRMIRDPLAQHMQSLTEKI